MKPARQRRISRQRIKTLGRALAFGGLFWLGYHYIETLNRPPAMPSVVLRPSPVLPVNRRYEMTDPLLEVKLSRDRERSREMEQIQTILDRQNLSSEVRQQAERELWRLTQTAVKEGELESVLQANGVKNNLAKITPNLVTVIIADKIDPEQVKLIGRLAAETTDYQLDQIRIVNAPAR
jgi:stage III sporulation protein AH